MIKAKVLKKFLALAISVSVCVGTSISYNRSNVVASESDVEFWSTYATEKVLRDEPTKTYSSVKGAAEVSVRACQGEYEGTQLIMTAKQNVDAYKVELTDLTLEGGQEVFDKDNILVYAQKYIQVKTNYAGNGAKTGWYPDALLPIETSVEYKENNIAKGKNQGLFITFNVPTNQKPGSYSGTMKVTVDGVKTDIPVYLKVEDILVSQTTHTKSKFNAVFHHHIMEKDSTQAMMEKYIGALAEYRLSPGTVMYEPSITKTQAGANLYVNTAYKLLSSNSKMSSFRIPFFSGMRDNVRTIDVPAAIMYIQTVVEKSLETGFNLMKCANFSGPIDEPDLFGLMDRVPYVVTDFNSAVTTVANSITGLAQKYPNATPEFIAEITESTKNLPLVVTMSRTSEADSMGVKTYCPKVNAYHTTTSRANYNNQKEKWWYTCITPRPPYPGYQIEDTLLSARALSWMMSEYDVVGNFFWAVDVGGRYDGTQYNPIEDFYTTAERYPKANGDGFLFYPGAEYGLDGPVGSIRLESIRDGLEEYELFYELNQIYSSLGFSTKSVQRNLASTIYSGTQVSSTSADFARSRNALIDLVKLAKSPAQVCVQSASVSGSTITYKVYCKNGYDLYSNGKLLTGGTASGAGKIYTISIDLSKVNYMNFSVEISGVKYEFNYRTGGLTQSNNASQLASGFSQNNGTLTTALINASTIGQGSGQLVHLKIGAQDFAHQSVNLTNELVKKIDGKVRRATLTIINNTTEDIPFMWLVKYSGSTMNYNLLTTTLAPGVNSVTISGFSTFDWNKYKSIEKFILYFTQDSMGMYPERNIYIKELVVYDS